VRELASQGPAALRLREMGVLPGVAITLMRTAPLGDPLETLRKAEAEHIMVEMVDGS